MKRGRACRVQMLGTAGPGLVRILWVFFGSLQWQEEALKTSFDSSGRFLYGPCRQDDQMPIEPHRRGGKRMARARTSVVWHQPWLAAVRQQVVTQLAPKALVAGEPPPVKVDGCQDAATAHVIEGPLGSIWSGSGGSGGSGGFGRPDVRLCGWPNWGTTCQPGPVVTNHPTRRMALARVMTRWASDVLNPKTLQWVIDDLIELADFQLPPHHLPSGNLT